jgi:hypothetical protein
MSPVSCGVAIATHRFLVFLMVADSAVFLDYGHWDLVPAVAQPLLQSLGLGLLHISDEAAFRGDVDHVSGLKPISARVWPEG